MKRYELNWFGSPGVEYEEGHDTIESAEAEAHRVFKVLAENGRNPGQFTGLIYEGGKQIRAVFYPSW